MSFLGSKLAAGVAVAAVLATGGPSADAAAAAGDPFAARGGALFRAMDRNADGAVDGREAFAAGTWVFAGLDRNRDGYLSPGEASTAPNRLAAQATADQRRAIARLMRLAARYMDSNRDGWVSRREFDGLGGYLFRQADANRDGRLHRVEFDPLLQRIAGYAAEPRLSTLDR
jgi:hypothetical protein